MAGRPLEAARSLSAALEEIERLDGEAPSRERLELRCNTLITLALTDFMLFGLDAASARFAEAEAVIAQLGDSGLQARLDYQRASIYGRLGDLASAWQGLEGAAARLDAFTPREQCSVHLSRGMLAFELSRPQQALEAFAEAARLAGALGGVEQEFMARHNEGYAAYLLGDIPRSLAGMAAAELLAADTYRAPARLDRARVLLEAGLVREATEALHAGLADLPDEGHDQIRAEFDLELAKAERLAGHLDRAAVAATSAIETYRRIGATAWVAKATLVSLLVDLDRQQRSSRHGDDRGGGDVIVAQAAAALADQLVDVAGELGDSELADGARVVAAQALLLAGDAPAANTRLLSLERISSASLSDELDAAAVTARTLVATGDLGPARRILGRAARRLAAGQQGSASLDLRTARAVHGVRLAELDLDLAVPRGSGAVLEVLERWRSATDRLPSLGRPDDEQLASLTEQLRSVRGLMRGESDPEQLRDLEADASQLERLIRDRDWALSRRGTVRAVPVRVREARAHLLDVDRDLVWFFRHRGRIAGVGVIGGRAVLRDLMPADRATELAQRVRVDLRAAATHHLGPLSGAVWSSLRSSAAELDAGLLQPWRSSRGLVLVTCPEVSALPWSLLPSMRARPLTVAVSLTSFARRGLGGGPSVAGAAPEPAGAQAGVHISVGPAVPRASAEARALARTWGTRSRIAQPSSRQELVAALARPGIVHVAAHGTHQVESPLFSSLVLHDGPVFAHELQPTGVRADHVVLSACEVGLETGRPGHESLGLALSLLSLGARSAVAAVAPVPDDVAAATMARHHELLASGVPSDDALARAVADIDDVAAAFLNLGGQLRP
ncbi:CHAT domain-containing protein [Humibacillus xanthopallidus]|uniref:CHAT domain-containing protein n=1 Tax=Humibacillus xanthopallidus TaxID=412689 RepID=A0A543PL93_9MICO|nr:CHAT domain-containing protein [Humibacillus xanthopallidus]TQN44844.1 CHAT domain-containing protein [Humibacillus xanthopallidus]